MCGYVSYQDSRLQPFESDDELTPVECWERCIHGDACRNVLIRANGHYYSSDEAVATAMGCAECKLWEE